MPRFNADVQKPKPTNGDTMNTQDNVTSLSSTPKPQTAKEVIAANVKLLIEQLEAGHSEGLTAYLSAMGKFTPILSYVKHNIRSFMSSAGLC
jgi:hypothetical protein